MKKLLIIVCLLFFAGCQQATQQDQGKPKASHINYDFLESLEKDGHPSTYTYTTKVISDPPGARIEVDGDYIGDAPCEIKWNEWNESSADRVFTEGHIVRALPIYESHCVQVKIMWFDNKIPKTILFDMRLGPIPKQYKIDID
jgi:hypothetical protein